MTEEVRHINGPVSTGSVAISIDRVPEALGFLAGHRLTQTLVAEIAQDAPWDGRIPPEPRKQLLHVLTVIGFDAVTMIRRQEVHLRRWNAETYQAAAFQAAFGAMGAAGAPDATWVMVSETDEVWAECIRDGRHLRASVDVTVKATDV